MPGGESTLARYIRPPQVTPGSRLASDSIPIAGNELTLEPVINRSQLRQALARPLGWSTAGWIVAVAYPGTTWRRVPCGGWC